MNTPPRRLPRKVEIGPYRVQIVLASQTTLREVMDAEDDCLFNGCWDPMLGADGEKYHGRIFVLQTLSTAKKWTTLWHELKHALTDLEGWDIELREANSMQKGHAERWRNAKR